MDRQKLHNALQELADFVKNEIRRRMASSIGNNRKGQNTLVGSDIYNNLQTRVNDDGITLEIADYWIYISTGWKFNDFNSEKRGLFNALVDWALKKVTSDNEEAFHLAGALWHSMIVGKKGVHRTIPGRPFLVFDKEGYEEDILTEAMLPGLKEYIDKWFDTLFETIIEDLDKYFN